jgi:RNA recognition motif-containing protein
LPFTPQPFLFFYFFVMNIYVSNLSFAVENEDLKGFFEEYGEVSSARIITDKETGRSRGFGFVEMPDNAAAQKAVSELNGTMVEGRSISVTEARPKEEKTGGGGYGGGGNYGGGGGGNRGGGGYGGGGNKRW